MTRFLPPSATARRRSRTSGSRRSSDSLTSVKENRRPGESRDPLFSCPGRGGVDPGFRRDDGVGAQDKPAENRDEAYAAPVPPVAKSPIPGGASGGRRREREPARGSADGARQ